MPFSIQEQIFKQEVCDSLEKKEIDILPMKERERKEGRKEGRKKKKGRKEGRRKQRERKKEIKERRKEVSNQFRS